MNRTTHARHGFTLVELLIVIAILLALGGIVLVGYRGVKQGADTDLQRVQFDRIADAIDHFELALNRRPTEDEGLEVLWSKDAIEDEDDMAKWRGPYLEEPIREDLWGNEIIYRNPSEERGDGFYDLISVGPDGEEDTEDDVTNHDRARDAEGEIKDEFDGFAPVEGSGAGS